MLEASVVPAHSTRGAALDVRMSMKGERLSRRNLGLLSLGAAAALVGGKPSDAGAETSSAIPLFPIEDSFLTKPPPQLPKFEPTPDKLPWEGRKEGETGGAPPTVAEIKEVIKELTSFREKIVGDALATSDRIGKDTKNPIPRDQTMKALQSQPDIVFIDKALVQLNKQLAEMGQK